MNTTPFKNRGITDPKLLFGRRAELKTLCDYADGLQQVEIIGARRFGKTCLTKVFITLQKHNQNRTAYPIYLDPYSDNIKGTANVYRYITANIICNLYNDKYIDDSVLSIDEFNIAPKDQWIKIYKQLNEVTDVIDSFSIFDDTVFTFSEQIGQTILLIFDEYEKAVDSFDKIEGLLHIRKLSTEPSNPPISFWIVGASPWRKFVKGSRKDVRGSGVFNGVTQELYVRPINMKDFSELWEHECCLIPEESKQALLKSFCEEVYESSGGVPCFAKEIGAYIYFEGDRPKYNRLSNHFSEIEKNLTESEIKCLRKLLVSSDEFEIANIPDSIVSLESFGLISLDENNRYIILSRLFAEYIRAKMNDEELNSMEDPSAIDAIVSKIEDTIYSINDKWKNIHGEFMFDPTNDTQKLYKNLRTRCDSSEMATNFVNAIYLLYWEGSKKDNAGEKLPKSFKWTNFRKALDQLRHVIGKAHQQDKLELMNRQMDKPTALRVIWGYTTEPQSSEDWLIFQDQMLSLFLKELEDLNKSICITNQGRVTTFKSTSRVVTGVFYKGRPGKTDTVVQDYNGYTQEVRSIRNGVSLSGGESVEYNLCRDPKNKRWFATDVHLKQD